MPPPSIDNILNDFLFKWFNRFSLKNSKKKGAVWPLTKYKSQCCVLPLCNYYTPISISYVEAEGLEPSIQLCLCLTFCRMGSEAIQHPETAMCSTPQRTCQGKFYDTISGFNRIMNNKRHNWWNLMLTVFCLSNCHFISNTQCQAAHSHHANQSQQKECCLGPVVDKDDKEC